MEKLKAGYYDVTYKSIRTVAYWSGRFWYIENVSDNIREIDVKEIKFKHD